MRTTLEAGPETVVIAMGVPEARCPLRPGERCGLCVPGATGPQDCPTVALVMSDPELCEELFRLRRSLP